MSRTLFAFAVVLSLSVAGVAQAQEQAEAPQEYQPQVTEKHQLLKKDVGTWDAEFTFWPAGPESESITVPAVEKNSMLGNLWLVSEFRCKMMGQDFIGQGQYGYDPLKEKYVGTWVSTMNPTLSTMEGTYDEKTKTLTLMSENTCMITHQPFKAKQVQKWIDDDHKVFTMYMQEPGNPESDFAKAMEIKYTRQK